MGILNPVMAAREIVAYLDSTRGAGHTRAAIEGADATGAIVVFDSYASANLLNPPRAGLAESIVLTDLMRLRGCRKPLVMDNFALRNLLLGLLREIDMADAMKGAER